MQIQLLQQRAVTELTVDSYKCLNAGDGASEDQS